MTGPPHPGAYVHGPGVFVPDAVAALLHRRLPLDHLREEVRGQDLAVYAVLVALRMAARRAVTASAGASASGSEVGAESEAGPGWEQQVTTQVAAERLGCTPRRVRQLLQAGRLRGARAAGRWVIRIDDLQEFMDRRAAA